MAKRKKNTEPWGNSFLAENFRNWECSYCGNRLADGKRFKILKINGNALPSTFCSQFCEKLQIKKYELRHIDR